MLRAALFLLLILPVPAMAELISCQTSIRGKTYEFRYDPDNDALKDSRSLREKIFGEKGQVNCPALVTLRAITPELDDAQRAPFCLQWDPERETYLGYDRGERDAYGMCREPSKSICQRLTGSAEAAGKLRDGAIDAAGGAFGTVLGDKIGGMIVSDQADRLQKRLVDAGLAVLAGASTPALAATAVVVGGAVYVCSEDGADGVGVQAEPVPEPDNGAEILGSELPVTHLAPGVTGAPLRPVETKDLPGVSETEPPPQTGD
ncbi:hypothetical protein [Thioclava pacifica]|uniref:Uncharacterized protein n=1 Tax=Thioclava pacifica DSM 10166 TaxID=1353537 RepID=A0A074JEN9_9RHOB|nr:hypothetical protein [Thioclava pacifica]KEO56091.1 hypothetical protein TP2_00800 [Thioclava pacifica DSM 10166]